MRLFPCTLATSVALLSPGIAIPAQCPAVIRMTELPATSVADSAVHIALAAHSNLRLHPSLTPSAADRRTSPVARFALEIAQQGSPDAMMVVRVVEVETGRPVIIDSMRAETRASIAEVSARDLAGRIARRFPASESCVPAPLAWRDPSPHRTMRVQVAPGVTLEVLDWGGEGPTLLFLPGIGQTAHSFDDFAPRFRDQYRVLGITRRGFGASSRPRDGYSSARRALDIIAVMDTLRVDRAVLAGHSFAGDELSRIAVTFPARVRALVYLDAYDYGTASVAALQRLRPPPAAYPPMTTSDSASPAAVKAWMQRVHGVALPEGEIRAMYSFGRTGRVMRDSLASLAARAEQQSLAGSERAHYRRIRAPALGLFAGMGLAPDFFAMYPSFSAEDRRVGAIFLAEASAWAERTKRRFRAEIPDGTLIEIPNAHHFVFVSHPDEVEVAMREFLGRIR